VQEASAIPTTRAALAGVAASCIRLGDAEYAVELADMIEDDGVYAMAAEEMAVAYAESGAADKSIEVAYSVGESAPILSRIALAYVARGETDQASRSLAQSITRT